MKTLGIDIGSRNTKIVIFDHDKCKIVFSAWQATQISATGAVDELLQKAQEAGAAVDIVVSCVTGYGRKMYTQADIIKSEISCHAAACYHLFPQARTEIGRAHV